MYLIAAPKKALFTILLITCYLALPNLATAQTDSAGFIRMPASKNFHKSDFYQKLWGKHYRTVWHTPVLFQKVDLDTLAGA